MHSLKTTLSLIALIASATLTGAGASAAPIEFQEGVSPNTTYLTPDGGIRSGTPDTSYGGVLDVGRISTNTTRSLIYFDLSAALQTTDQIGAITLQLTKERQSGTWDDAERTISIYRVAPFVEGQVTWNKASSSTTWTTPGGDYDSTKPLASVVDVSGLEETLTFATTPEFVAAAQDALQNQNGRLYLLLSAPGAENSDGTYAGFHQAEDDATDRPKLSVTLVPEPGALGLLGIAGFTLLGRWRSR